MMRTRLTALLGLLLLAGALWAASPTLMAQADLPAERGRPSRAWHEPFRERWRGLTEEEETRLQAARNAILEAQIGYLRELVELGLISQEAADARIERLTALKEAPRGLVPCYRLGPGGPRDARFRWGMPGLGWRARMGRDR